MSIDNYGPEWAKLSVEFPPGCDVKLPNNGDAAHKLAAKAAGLAEGDPRYTVPPEFFHRAQKGDVHGLSPFRYGSGRNAMYLTAVGDDAADLLRVHAHHLTRCISKMVGMPVKETISGGNLSIHAARGLYHYRIGYAVATRKPLRAIPVGHDLAAKNATDAVREWLGHIILEGIARQCRLVGLLEPDVDALLRVESIAGMCGLYHGENRAYYGSVVKGVEFTSDIHLKGPWSIGCLCLTGEGRIAPA